MKNNILPITVLVSSIVLIGCNQKQIVPVYTINEVVDFIDSNEGSIMLNNQSCQYDESITFSFTLDLNETFMFDDLFSHYEINLNHIGITLRYFNDHSTPTNLREDYTIIINDIPVEINQLSDYVFTIGESIISFSFGSNFVSEKDDVVSLSFTYDKIIPYANFSL